MPEKNSPDIPMVGELRNALFAAQRRRTGALHTVEFTVKLELRATWRTPPNSVLGCASRLFRAPVVPRAGEYLVGIGPWGERPLTSHLRVDRVEIAPEPQWELRNLEPQITVTATGFIYEEFKTARVERAFVEHGWTTVFSTSID